MTATYSPEDNKLRIYPTRRLDTPLYNRLREAGYKWAPKQELFVAPMWTPDREDLALELCGGEIGDEDTSLVERAEERAGRFEEYQGTRAKDAERAQKAVSAIADGIPLGQPILIGHHSERRARKDAEKIRSGMERAVKMWETSEYWKRRADGALAAAKYKELPGVRARRIKGLEADKRKLERGRDEAKKFIEMWADDARAITRKDGAATTFMERARRLCAMDYVSKCFTLADFPRAEGASNYEGVMSLSSALGGPDEVPIITPEQARDIAVRVHERTIARSERWIRHYENRLLYEKAMLNEQGAGELLDKRSRPKQLPLLNYRAPEGLYMRRYNNVLPGERAAAIANYHFPQVEMTQAEYAKLCTDRKGTRPVKGTHRVRTAMLTGYKLVCVFLTDAKVHPVPTETDEETKPTAAIEPAERPLPTPRYVAPDTPEAATFKQLAAQLKAGIQVISAPQLFPTPRELGRRMARIADCAGKRVLEPSAGTGELVRAIINDATGANCVRVAAVEVNAGLVRMLDEQRQKTLYANETNFIIRQADFLDIPVGELGEFDCVVMNPPFEGGADIKHIRHAWKMLKVGGRLVAICAGGPRQEGELKPWVEAAGGTWERLEEGTFKESGTGVNTVLLVIDKES